MSTSLQHVAKIPPRVLVFPIISHNSYIYHKNAQHAMAERDFTNGMTQVGTHYEPGQLNVTVRDTTCHCTCTTGQEDICLTNMNAFGVAYPTVTSRLGPRPRGCGLWGQIFRKYDVVTSETVPYNKKMLLL